MKHVLVLHIQFFHVSMKKGLLDVLLVQSTILHDCHRKKEINNDQTFGYILYPPSELSVYQSACLDQL